MKSEKHWQKVLIAAALAVGFGGVLFGLASLAAAQQAQQASPWKDRAEYDAYTAIEQAAQPNQRVEAADKYLAAYPESKVLERVYALKLQAYQQLNNSAKIEESAAKLLELNPKNFQALYLLSFLIPRTINVQDSGANAKLDALAGYAARGLQEVASIQMPQGMAPAQFEEQKKQSAAVFHQSAGFAALQKKDYAKAVTSLRSSGEISPNDGLTFYWLGSAYLSPQPPQHDPGIWAMARAVSITGPNALPAAIQQQVKDYVTKVYEARHGSANGLDQILAQAAGAPFPPAGFHVQTLEETPEYKAEQEKLRQEEEAARREAERVAALRERMSRELSDFDVITEYLSGGGQRQADAWEFLKGSSLGLPGKVVTATPGAAPTTVRLAVSPELAAQPGKFDLELTLAAPNPRRLAAGQDIEFEATFDAYTANPFLLKMVNGKITKQ
jgi:tetratricopeptide (TPR) repeat protein